MLLGNSRRGRDRLLGKDNSLLVSERPTGESFEKTHHGMRNAVEWTRKHVQHRLNNDLELLE